MEPREWYNGWLGREKTSRVEHKCKGIVLYAGPWGDNRLGSVKLMVGVIYIGPSLHLSSVANWPTVFFYLATPLLRPTTPRTKKEGLYWNLTKRVPFSPRTSVLNPLFTTNRLYIQFARIERLHLQPISIKCNLHQQLIQNYRTFVALNWSASDGELEECLLSYWTN